MGDACIFKGAVLGGVFTLKLNASILFILANMTDVTAVMITGFAIAGLVSIMFLSYLGIALMRKVPPIGVQSQTLTGPRRFSGIFGVVLGPILILAWVYFMISGWEAFMANPGHLMFHVVTQLLSGIMLWIAGVGMLRQWSVASMLFMLSNAFLLLTMLFSVLIHGQAEHPVLMDGVAILLTIVSGYFVSVIFNWEHFVLKLDTKVDDPS